MENNTNKLLYYLVDTAHKNKLEQNESSISINIPIYLRKKLSDTISLEVTEVNLSKKSKIQIIDSLTAGGFNFVFKYNIEPELVFTEIVDYI